MTSLTGYLRELGEVEIAEVVAELADELVSRAEEAADSTGLVAKEATLLEMLSPAAREAYMTLEREAAAERRAALLEAFWEGVRAGMRVQTWALQSRDRELQPGR